MNRSARAFINLVARRRFTINAKDFPDHRSLVVEKFGEPVDSVTLRVRAPSQVLPDKLEPNQVLLEHIAACVNPADINLIQGVYGVKPQLPAVIGNEGVTRVKHVGSNVSHLEPGDLAIGVSLIGYWQNYSIQDASDLYKIDSQLDVRAAAQLKVNPCTAYRMMKDFCDMKAGETMIQNGANSAVGIYAIQLAKHWGIKTINVIRDRANKSDIVDELKAHGADYVLTEEEIRNSEIVKPILSQVGQPRLFLNCVSGKNAVSCLRLLAEHGYCVTYGFMAKQPLTVGAQSMFKDHKLCFYWMSRWYGEREAGGRNDIDDMLKRIGDMFIRGVLKPKSSTMISFEDRNVAFTSPNNTKYIFSIKE